MGAPNSDDEFGNYAPKRFREQPRMPAAEQLRVTRRRRSPCPQTCIWNDGRRPNSIHGRNVSRNRHRRDQSAVVIVVRPVFTGDHICGCRRAGNYFLQTGIACCQRPIRTSAALETIRPANREYRTVGWAWRSPRSKRAVCNGLCCAARAGSCSTRPVASGPLPWRSQHSPPMHRQRRPLRPRPQTRRRRSRRHRNRSSRKRVAPGLSFAV